MTLHRLTALIAVSLSAAFFVHGASAGTHNKRVDKRQARQEQRIDQGQASGALTDKEARRLDKGQDHVDKVEDHAKADGKLTRRERAHLEHAQNKQSRRIARQKHDRQTAPN